MKKLIPLFFLFFCTFPILGQDGFQFANNADKVVVPFKFINNLIFIPIKVNGIELNFLLDTGVEETILFSLDDKKEMTFLDVEKISLRGLGGDDSIEGLKSNNNTLSIGNVVSKNQLLYIVLDQGFNLSSHVGIPVNGIIGYNFFKSNLIEINYDKKKVIIYKDTTINRKKIEKKYTEVAITIERSKPYVWSSAVINNLKIPTKLLVDIGNSDAIWLFPNSSKSILIPSKNFEDYLGKGFSGDVEGKRARISNFKFFDYEFDNPVVSFPDLGSIKNVKMVPDRAGSVGSEILKRFSIVFDYGNQKMYLKKSGSFELPFNYNRSGIELQHYGLQWVQATVHLETVVIVGESLDTKGKSTDNNFKYKFELKPIYSISYVRPNSPASVAGLEKGDIIIEINNNSAYNFSLQRINSLLKSEDEKWITLEIERDNKRLKFKIQLLDVL